MIKEKDEIKQLEYDTIFKATFIRRQEVLIKMIRDVFEIEDDINNPLFIVGYELVPHSKRGKSYKSDILIKLSDDSYIFSFAVKSCNTIYKKGLSPFLYNRNLMENAHDFITRLKARLNSRF